MLLVFRASGRRGVKKLITSTCTSKNLWFGYIVTPTRPQEGHRISYDDMILKQLRKDPCQLYS